jgi:hypothetical protein
MLAMKKKDSRSQFSFYVHVEMIAPYCSLRICYLQNAFCAFFGMVTRNLRRS